MRTGTKVLLCIGSLNLLAEGALELRQLLRPFTQPESVPGAGKIYEHFALQHLLFPGVGIALVVEPRALAPLFRSRASRALLGGVAAVVTAVEINTSRRDLFRAYPFRLPTRTLRRLEHVPLRGRQLNLVQLAHLVTAHGAVMGCIVITALRPDWLDQHHQRSHS